MFENIKNFFKKLGKKQDPNKLNKEEAKERLHLVLLQDRANVSADFLELMKQEIIEVIKKYIDVDESKIDVKLTNKQNSDGTTGAPALYANIPIVGIKNATRKITNKIKLDEIGNNENNSENNIEKSDKNKSKAVSTKGKGKKSGKTKNTKKAESLKANVEEQKEAKEKEVKEETVNVDKTENQSNNNSDKANKKENKNAKTKSKTRK